MGCGGSKKEEYRTQVDTAHAPDASGKTTEGGTQLHAAKSVSSSGPKTVLGKYQLVLGNTGMLGEGSFCVCRKAIDAETGLEVAVKMYKPKQSSPDKEKARKEEKVQLMKFRRQIEVLSELSKQVDRKLVAPRHWSDHLAEVDVQEVFVQLVDYSKDKSGQPGNDLVDGIPYVVTELAEYNMKEWLTDRRGKQRPLSRRSLHETFRDFFVAVAMLHAKNMVHLDLKPENVMRTKNRWKLIDVDGCLKLGSKVNIREAAVSFSPCYTAPEWSACVVEAKESTEITSLLDVWSTGISLLELFTLEVFLKPVFVSYLKSGCPMREAGFLFMDWLSRTKEHEFPKKVEKFDKDAGNLMKLWLQVDASERKTLVEMIDHPFMKKCLHAAEERRQKELGREKPESGNASTSCDSADPVNTVRPSSPGPDMAERTEFKRRLETDHRAPVFKSILYKLNSNAEPGDKACWLRRDMWITKGGCLAYRSEKQHTNLLYLDHRSLTAAKVTRLDRAGTALPFAFRIEAEGTNEKGGSFAAESELDLEAWLKNLEAVKGEDFFDLHTMHMTVGFMEKVKEFQEVITNRRRDIGVLSGANKGSQVDQEFSPVFKASLWKLRHEGDPSEKDQWDLREMWIAENGSLCYQSVKENKPLMYYNSDDLARSTIGPSERASWKQFSFHIIPAAVDECEFEPGIFACDTEEEATRWQQELLTSMKRNPYGSSSMRRVKDHARGD